MSLFLTLCRFTLCRAFDPFSFDPESFDPLSFEPVSFDPLSVNQKSDIELKNIGYCCILEIRHRIKEYSILLYIRDQTRHSFIK